MTVYNVIPNTIISQYEINSSFTQDFLNTFNSCREINLYSGTVFDFRIKERIYKNKINPIIRKATTDDISEILFIYDDIYDGTYPYKEICDPKNIQNMLKRKDVEWLMFEHPKTREIIGTFTFTLDFDDKKGYTRGFVIKNKFCGKFDVLKAFMGSFLAMYQKYNGEIFRWYGESRTAHAKSQYCMKFGGFYPVAFLPNKDFFYNKVESDILLISYDKRAITEYRSNKKPKIIPSALGCFKYSDRRYNLGRCNLFLENVKIDHKELVELSEKLKVEVKKDKYGYQNYMLYYNDRANNSYLTFLYTPMVQNFEKIEYHVNSPEELLVFINILVKIARELNIRYFEVYISAYNPIHQKLFFDAGLMPRGYIPSWKYDMELDIFKDYILFNWFSGKLAKYELLEEGLELLYAIDLMIE
ncbi:MAG: hypothetical protein ACP6IY_06475 [Promethearchaeia archaeon]